MKQAALENTSITSGVNESRFLDHLRTMFTNSTTVLAECLQNGRRAGASSVDFDYDDATSTLIITDNGCGIADFRALITVAESGWSQETIDSERPFGIGFFSVSFAAETVVVESKGKQIVFSSEDLIAKRQIAVRPSSFIGGTRISLRQCKLDAEKVAAALATFAKGFAIPVVWKGEELPRPHAQTALPGVMTPSGFIHVPGIHDQSKGGYEGLGFVYCQGLPVKVSGFTRHYGLDMYPVIHVDHLKYQPRMPDRDSLIDADQAAKAFSKDIQEIWREHLVAKKAELSAVEFAESCWADASKAGCLELMCDIPVLPSHQLAYVGEAPFQDCDWGSHMYSSKVHVTQADVASGAIQLCSDVDYEGVGDEFAKLLFAQEAKLLFLSGRLPERHWATPYIRHLSEEKVLVGGRVLNTDHFSGAFASGSVKLVENLAVTMGGVTKMLTEPVALGSDAWGAGMTFLVPKGVRSAGHVLRQASTYTDGNDNYCETDYNIDVSDFDNLVAILAGESGTETLEKCLIASGAMHKTNLRNNTFLVRFDEEGNMTVESA